MFSNVASGPLCTLTLVVKDVCVVDRYDAACEVGPMSRKRRRKRQYAGLLAEQIVAEVSLSEGRRTTRRLLREAANDRVDTGVVWEGVRADGWTGVGTGGLEAKRRVGGREESSCRIGMSTRPSKSSPYQSECWEALGSSAARPVPQIASYGLGSARILLSVPKRKLREFEFRPNLHELAWWAIPRRLVSHTRSSKPDTARRMALCSAGSEDAMIY